MTPERVAELAKGKAIDGIGWDSFAADIAAESERELAAERERCCRAVCKFCEIGQGRLMVSESTGDHYHYYGDRVSHQECKADPIRRLSASQAREKEEKL